MLRVPDDLMPRLKLHALTAHLATPTMQQCRLRGHRIETVCHVPAMEACTQVFESGVDYICCELSRSDPAKG
jgi:hypothetical protein